MEFRCGDVTNGTGDYHFFPCQKGGECITNSVVGQICVGCEPGWTHDFYGFGHFYNCAIPVWAPLTFLILHTIILVIGLSIVAFLFLRSEIRPGKTRTVAVMASVCGVFAWISLLSAYLQEGVFEASLVALLFLGAIGLCFSPIIVPALLTPVAVLSNSLPVFKRMSMIFRAISGLLVMTHAGLLIAAIMHCRDVNQDVFNRITLAALWHAVAAIGLQSIITLAVCHRLGVFFVNHDKRTTTSNSNGSSTAPSSPPFSPFLHINSISEQRHRMILSQLCVIVTVCGIGLFMAIILCVPLTLWALYHSLPYMWGFHLIAFPVISLCYPLLIPFVRGASVTQMQRPRSSDDHHFLSENADVFVEEGSRIRTLGLKKTKRNQLWRIKLINALSRVSEESQIESRNKTTFISKLSLSELPE